MEVGETCRAGDRWCTAPSPLLRPGGSRLRRQLGERQADPVGGSRGVREEDEPGKTLRLLMWGLEWPVKGTGSS